MSLRRAAAAVALLAAVGISRQAFQHLVAEPIQKLPQRMREPRAEMRYLAVRAALPPAGRVGYLTDLPVTTAPDRPQPDELGTWLYEQAQYALAPLVLVVGETRTEAVLANVVDPAQIDALAAAQGLRVAERFEGGRVAVLRR